MRKRRGDIGAVVLVGNSSVYPTNKINEGHVCMSIQLQYALSWSEKNQNKLGAQK